MPYYLPVQALCYEYYEHEADALKPQNDNSAALRGGCKTLLGSQEITQQLFKYLGKEIIMTGGIPLHFTLPHFL